MSWSLQDASIDLSSLVEKAITEGVQIVTSHGEPTVVVLAADDYDRLVSARPSIVDHLLAGPKWDDDIADDIADRARIPRHPSDV